MRKSLLVVLMAVALVAGACGDDDDPALEGGSVTTEAGGANTVEVQVDAHPESLNTYALQYFPKEVTVHPGDTVDFKSNFRGEPHTVAFGTTVDPLIKAFEALTPEQLESDGPPPPEFEALFQKLPSVFPEEDLPVSEIKLNQAAAQPCYVETGDAPKEGKCPVQSQPEFTGTQTLYNSGFLADGKTFSVKLPDTLSPGSYSYMCLVHFTEMVGKVTVVGKDAKAQTPAEVEAAGKSEIDAFVAPYKAAADKARAEVKPGQVAAGVIAEGDDVLPGEAIVFEPAEVSVPVNGTVTWAIKTFHTVSFGFPEDARPDVVVGADGDVQLNQKTFARLNSPEPPEPPESDGPPDPDAPLQKLNGGTYDGTGFKNSGDLSGIDYSVTFTKAGTYKYACLIHTDMEGTVKVG